VGSIDVQIACLLWMRV